MSPNHWFISDDDMGFNQRNFGILSRSTNQSIAHATITGVSFDAHTNTDNEFRWNISDPTKLYLESGVWLIVANVDFANNNTKERHLQLDDGIATWISINHDAGQAAAGTQRLQIVGLVVIPSGQATRFSVWQNTGAALNIIGGEISLYYAKVST